LFFSKKLSEKEIQALLEKIKIKYVEYGFEYGRGYFNLDKFYDRYYQAVNTGIDLETFFHAEVSAIEGIIKRIEDKKLQQISVPGESVMEKIFDEYAARLKKYRRITLHPRALEEIEKLYGCVTDLNDNYSAGLARLAGKLFRSRAKEAWAVVQYEMEQFTSSRINRLPPYFEDYCLSLAQAGPKPEDVLDAGYPLLKKAFRLFRSLNDFLSAARDEQSSIIHLRLPVGGKLYEYDGFFKLLQAEIRQIMHDFRFKGLE